MTRINLVDPKMLTDQHLLTEYRELPRIFGNVRVAIAAGKTWQRNYAKNASKDFVLGTGHMVFFYNKLMFLANRQLDIIAECIARDINISYTEGLDYSDIPESWLGNYIPTQQAIKYSKARLDERISEKPDWYRFWGSSLDEWDEQPCYTLLDNYVELN